jgi:hypothetical protein
VARRRNPKTFSDEALVIRGGFNNRTQIRKQALRYEDTHGTTTISVFASPHGESVEQLAEIAGFGYPVMRLSTVGRIRAAGFDVVPHGRYGHGQVTFDDVSNATLDRFREAFDKDTIPNPTVS